MTLWVLWLHGLAAAAWIGGMVFLSAVLVPSLRKPDHRDRAPALFRDVGRRFRVVGWASLGLLVVTGVLNLGALGYRWEDLRSGRLWEGRFGTILAVKLFLVAVAIVLAFLHEWVLRPRAADPADSPQRARRIASWLGRATLALALVILWFALALRRA